MDAGRGKNGTLSDMDRQRYTRKSRGECYNAAIRWVNAGNEDEELSLLLNQFYYGIAAQKELVDRCIELGIVEC